MDNNERRAVVLPHSLLEALDKYAASKHISKSEAIRKFIEKGLSITSYEQSQTEIRNYIREEIETVMPIVMKNSLIKELRRQVGHNAAGALSETKHDDFTEAIFQKLTAIREMLPPKGQVVYKLMPKPVKQELNSLTHFMIDNIPEFSSLYDEILDCRRIYNEMLHSDDSSYGKLQMAAYMGKVVDEIEAGVGNTILSAILRAVKDKAKSPPERDSTNTNRHSEWQRQCAVQLISSVGKLLGQFSDSSRDRLHDASNQVFGRGDLSKEQIRELLLKKQDKENTAEM